MRAMQGLVPAFVLVLALSGGAQADDSSGRPQAAPQPVNDGHGWSGQGGGHHAGMPGHHERAGRLLHHLLRHQKELGLTEEQVSKLKTLSLDFDRSRIKVRADIMVAERELRALIHDDRADMAAIEAKIKESEGLQTGLRVTAIKTRREAWSLLTPEQREKEKAELKQWMRRHQEG